mgnify:FL=1
MIDNVEDSFDEHDSLRCSFVVELKWSFCSVFSLFLSLYYIYIYIYIYIFGLPVTLNWHLWQDVDCMPLDPMENIPTMLARHIAVDKFFENYNELRMNEQAKEYIKISSGDNVENINGLSNLSSSTYPVTNLLKQTKVCDFLFHFHYLHS